MINLTKLTINKARTLLDDKEISALELTKLYLDRIDDLDSQVASFLSVNYENAIEQAKQADYDISQGNSNILTGIPMQIKDNICTKGIPTTCASNMLEGFIPPYNSHIFERDKNMSEEKGNLKGLAVSFILISLIMGAGVGIVYFIGQSIY